MADELDPSPKVPKRDRKEAQLDVPDENASAATRVRRDPAAGLEPGDRSDTSSDYSDTSSDYSSSARPRSNATRNYSDTTSEYSDKENLRPAGVDSFAADGLPAPRARGPLLDVTEDFGAFANHSGARTLVPRTPQSLSGQSWSDELSHSSASTVTTRAAAPDNGADEFWGEAASNNKMLDHLNSKFKKVLKDRADKYYNGESGRSEHSGGQEDERGHEEPVSERTHAWLEAQEKERMKAVTEEAWSDDESSLKYPIEVMGKLTEEGKTGEHEREKDVEDLRSEHREENAPDKSASQISKAFEAIHAAIEVLQRAGMNADLCQAMKRLIEQVEKHWLDANGERTAAPASNSAADSTGTSRSGLFKSRKRERFTSR